MISALGRYECTIKMGHCKCGTFCCNQQSKRWTIHYIPHLCISWIVADRHYPPSHAFCYVVLRPFLPAYIRYDVSSLSVDVIHTKSNPFFTGDVSLSFLCITAQMISITLLLLFLLLCISLLLSLLASRVQAGTLGFVACDCWHFCFLRAVGTLGFVACECLDERCLSSLLLSNDSISRTNADDLDSQAVSASRPATTDIHLIIEHSSRQMYGISAVLCSWLVKNFGKGPLRSKWQFFSLVTRYMSTILCNRLTIWCVCQDMPCCFTFMKELLTGTASPLFVPASAFFQVCG